MNQTQCILKQLKFRNPHYYEFFPEDIDRIQRILFERGYNIAREDVKLAWEAHSNSMAASWLILSDNDDDVFTYIMDYLEEC